MSAANENVKLLQPGVLASLWGSHQSSSEWRGAPFSVSSRWRDDTTHELLERRQSWVGSTVELSLLVCDREERGRFGVETLESEASELLHSHARRLHAIGRNTKFLQTSQTDYEQKTSQLFLREAADRFSIMEASENHFKKMLKIYYSVLLPLSRRHLQEQFELLEAESENRARILQACMYGLYSLSSAEVLAYNFLAEVTATVRLSCREIVPPPVSESLLHMRSSPHLLF